jgi:hypothetical protein
MEWPEVNRANAAKTCGTTPTDGAKGYPLAANSKHCPEIV